MNKQQINIEMKVQCRLGLPGDTELIQHIKGIGDRNRRYIDSKLLNMVLSKRINNPGNLEYIAKDLAIYDPKNITTSDLLRYCQILEALKRAEVLSVPKSTIEEWAAKLLVIDQNPISFDYLMNMRKDKICNQEAKMEGIEKTNNSEDMEIVLNTRKRQQNDDNSDEEVNKGLDKVIGQMQALS